MDGTPGTAHADQPTAGTTEPTVDIREEAAADARAVVETAKDQTRGAMSNLKQEFRRQLSEQKSHVAGSIREIGDELEKARRCRALHRGLSAPAADAVPSGGRCGRSDRGPDNAQRDGGTTEFAEEPLDRQ